MITLPNGYTMETTFFMDFHIAEEFGPKAVEETFNNAFKSWKYNHIYLTILYTELYHKVDEYCMNNLKNDALDFYLRITD